MTLEEKMLSLYTMAKLLNVEYAYYDNDAHFSIIMIDVVWTIRKYHSKKNVWLGEAFDKRIFTFIHHELLKNDSEKEDFLNILERALIKY